MARFPEGRTGYCRAGLVVESISGEPCVASDGTLRNDGPDSVAMDGWHSKGKALSILSARLGRTVYLMLRKREAFDMKRFPERTDYRASGCELDV